MEIGGLVLQMSGNLVEDNVVQEQKDLESTLFIFVIISLVSWGGGGGLKSGP